MNRVHRRGFSSSELFALTLIAAVGLAATIPVLARTRAGSGIAGSMANIMTIGVAHVLYASDWNGRQVTWVVDDLSIYGSVNNYNQVHGCHGSWPFLGCHPAIRWGFGSDGWLYSYPMVNSGYHWALEAINFQGGAAYFGHFRFPNTRPLHDYVNGRVYDPVFFAPLDTLPLEIVEPSFQLPVEYDESHSPPIWTSYSMSPAAMFSPDVMRSNADGGWQHPWSIPMGHQSPGFFEPTYPALKTLILEHHWLQGAPAPCNPAIDCFGCVLPCEPYYFNHGVDSSPVTLFYDLNVRLMSNAEVLAADQLVLKQTGGVDGLWHRGTPFGENGYVIDFGIDGVPLSHHILTTDGILGRDTLGEQGPAAVWDATGFKPAAAARLAPFSITNANPTLMLDRQP